MNKLTDLRKIIDQIDEQILDLIKSRMDIVEEIGQIKKKNTHEIVDKKREEEIYNRLINRAEEKGVNPEAVKKIWKELLKISYEIEGRRDGNS